MVYFVPEVSVGHGLGHVHRVSMLASRLPHASRIVIPHAESEEDHSHRERLVSHATTTGEVEVVATIPDDAEGAVIIDRRFIDVDEVEGYPRQLTVCGLDTAGPARDLLDAVIDALPNSRARGVANEEAVFLPRVPRTRRNELPEAPERFLITFGGEDSAGLTETVVEGLVSHGIASARALTAVHGPLMARPLNLNIPVIEAPSNLREILAEYDLVLTSYGITAFEALAAGCRVVLVNPSRYHEQLAKRAGLPSGGGPRVKWQRLGFWIGNPTALDETLKAAVHPDSRELGEVLARYLSADNLGCPACHTRRNPTVGRLSGRSYFRCRACSMIYLSGFNESPITYDEAYFFEEYKAQYGRTYLEDFDHIAEMGARRLELIESLHSSRPRRPRHREAGADSPRLRLLDIGCAYGPFLRVAAEAGYEPYGIDRADSAVDYVRETLGFACAQGGAGEIDTSEALGIDTVAVATMWYVIEHVDDIELVLDWVASLLPMGGVFAFSTPNGAGVSARRSFEAFLAASPRDHRSIWTPAIARRVLRRHGFRVRRVRVTGHHPERFALGERAPSLRGLLVQWSKLFRRGDTFEVYAVKEGRQ